MIRGIPAAVAAVFFMILSAAVAVAEEKPGGEAYEVIVLTSTVEKIDLSAREVTLKGEDGGKQTFKIGPETRNLDQVMPGDRVTIKYYRALEVSVTPPGNVPSITEATNVQRAPIGEKPSGQVTNVVEATTTVEALDPAKRTVTIRGPKGDVKTYKVGDEVKRDRIKVGDQVVTRYTESIAVSVEKP